MSLCPPEDRLLSLVEGTLPEAEWPGLAGHVQGCPGCQRALEVLTDAPSLLGKRPTETPLLSWPVPPGPDDPPSDPGDDDEFDDADPASRFPFLGPPTRAGALGRLGHFEVLEFLGRGGFGIVFRAFDDALHRDVALKVLAPELAASPSARRRFLREARSAASVRHENVVQVHAVEERPVPFLVMEYVRGETLARRISRDGPLGAPDVARLGRQIARALAAAHASGLVHRDVKPANILIEEGPDGAPG